MTICAHHRLIDEWSADPALMLRGMRFARGPTYQALYEAVCAAHTQRQRSVILHASGQCVGRVCWTDHNEV